MDTFSEAVKAKKEYDTVYRNVKNLGIVDKIQISKPNVDVLQFHLLIFTGFSTSKIKKHNLTEEKLPIKFVESFGFGDEFKELFSEIEEITTCSKQEVSSLIRHKIVGKKVDDCMYSFEFKIPISKITYDL
jgi:hypothetical protein